MWYRDAFASGQACIASERNATHAALAAFRTNGKRFGSGRLGKIAHGAVFGKRGDSERTILEGEGEWRKSLARPGEVSRWIRQGAGWGLGERKSRFRGDGDILARRTPSETVCGKTHGGTPPVGNESRIPAVYREPGKKGGRIQKK